MKTFLAAALLLVFPAVAAAQFGGAAVPATPVITTSGESIVYVTPDEVTLAVGIEIRDVDLDKSKAELDRRSQTLLTAVKQSGIEAKDVQTDTINVSIDYTPGGFTIDGYVTRRSYVIKIRDTTKVESTVDVVLKNGANRLFGVDYQTTALRKYRDEARKMAIKAAKEKAQLLAGELEMTVTAPRQISEGTFWYGYGGGSFWGGRYANSMSQNSVSHAPDPSGTGEGTMPLGQIAIRAQVSVTFDMVPTK